MKAQYFGYAAIALAISVYRNPMSHPLEWGDFLMFGLAGLLLWWCLSVRSGEATSHERLDQGVAFRLGKALNYIRRGKGI